MQATLTREFGEVNLDILVDYDEDGISIEDILYRGESVMELLEFRDIRLLIEWVDAQYDKLLESDEYARADEKNDYRKD